MSSQNPVAILRAIDCLNAPGSILLLLESDVNPKGLVVPVLALPIADGYLLNIAVLSEKLGTPECLEQLVLAYRRRQPGYVDQVFLNDSDADQVLPILLFGFAFLGFLVALLGGTSLLVLLNIRSELGNPMNSQHRRRSRMASGGVAATYSSCVTTFH